MWGMVCVWGDGGVMCGGCGCGIYAVNTHIRTDGSGYYVGMAPWVWYSFKRLKMVTKRCLYSPASIYS